MAAMAAVRTEAQNAGLSRQVEVIKEYVPDAGVAMPKVDFVPQIGDTTLLRPEMEYGIRPTGYVGRFGIPDIAPMTVSVDEYKFVMPFYIKAGAGYPWNGLLDFYWSHRDRYNIGYGAYYNHDGRYGKATSDLGLRRKALTATNYAGGFASKEFGRYVLKAGIDMFFNEYTAYGAYTIDSLPLNSYGANERFNYKGISGDVTFGDTFTDLSRLNFRLGGRLGTTANTVQQTDTKSEFFGEIGKAFRQHTAILSARVRSYCGSDARSYFTLEPRYAVEGVDFTLDAGLKVNFGSGLRLFPQLNLKYDVWGGYIIPYVEIDGGLTCGDMERMLELNPYVVRGILKIADLKQYNLRGGVAGSLSDNLYYKAFVGVSSLLDMSFFVSDYSEGRTARFLVERDNGTMFTLGGSMEFKLYDKLRSWAAARYYGYTLDHFERACGLPNFEVRVGGRYEFTPKWRASLGATLLGRRYFFERIASTGDLLLNKARPSFNLEAQVDYRHSRFIHYFLRGENLFNSKLYPWNHYRSVGLTVQGGVVLSF
jgi:hypothetical protein